MSATPLDPMTPDDEPGPSADDSTPNVPPDAGPDGRPGPSGSVLAEEGDQVEVDQVEVELYRVTLRVTTDRHGDRLDVDVDGDTDVISVLGLLTWATDELLRRSYPPVLSPLR